MLLLTRSSDKDYVRRLVADMQETIKIILENLQTLLKLLTNYLKS